MSMKKILAAAAASVVAVSAVSTLAFADDFTKTDATGYVDAWTCVNLIGDTVAYDDTTAKENFGVDTVADLANIESITFTSTADTGEWTIGYDAVDGWKQGDSAAIGGKTEAGFCKGADTLTISDINWAKGDGMCIKICYNNGDDCSVTWTVKMKDGAGTDTPADSTADNTTSGADDANSTVADSTATDSTAADSTADTTTSDKGNVNTGVEGVAAVLGVAVVAAGAMVVAKKRK